MTMKKCKECGADVSSKAEKCPSCGAPIKKRVGCLGATIGTVFVLFIVAMVISVVSPPAEKLPADTAASASASSTKATQAQVAVAVLKKTLRNPQSFDPIEVLVMDSRAVCMKYRAENGFGGMSVEQAVFSADGKRAANSNESGFASLWNAECAGKTGFDATAIFAR